MEKIFIMLKRATNYFLVALKAIKTLLEIIEKIK